MRIVHIPGPKLIGVTQFNQCMADGKAFRAEECAGNMGFGYSWKRNRKAGKWPHNPQLCYRRGLWDPSQRRVVGD